MYDLQPTTTINTLTGATPIYNQKSDKKWRMKIYMTK